MSIIEKAAQRLAEKRAQGHLERTEEPTGPVAPAVASAAVSGQRDVGSPPAGQAQAALPEGEVSAATEDAPVRAPEPDLHVLTTGNDLVLSPDGGRSRTAEEFRMIKRPLLVNAFDRRTAHHAHPNLIMITSSVQGEGKTFTSLNLAISITMELDSTVLLVDADVARPGLSRALGIADKPGLIERLVDERVDLSSLLLRTDIPKLTVLPAGQKHKRSTELLASGTMRRLLDELANRYADRIVLFDSPPLLETSEASVVAAQMGQVVVVVEHESTSQVIVKEALSQFESTDNVYCVLNKCKENIFSGRYGYGPGYGYGYGYGSYGEK